MSWHQWLISCSGMKHVLHLLVQNLSLVVPTAIAHLLEGVLQILDGHSTANPSQFNGDVQRV